jgi:hypothetical protein
MKIGGVEVDAEILKNLPNLPGFAVPVFKERNGKQQTWGVFNGTRIEKVEGQHEKPKFVQAVRPKDNWNSGSLPDSHSRSVFAHSSLNKQEYMDVPAWDALDRHVLRFNGYFKEAVVETNLENYRVRKVVILYYLEDDTCQVTEPRQDNSGIPQGTLIRRHRFPGPSGGYLKIEDLQIGSELNLYGRSIRMTNCDPFTREYYQHLGIEQAEPATDENDPFLSTREALKTKHAKAPRTYEKVYREAMLGGGHINTDMQQFLEKDRKVLRFYSVLDDLTTPQFERRPFILMFFLADDTMEIRELYPLNCGRDNFPIFFKRGKMARGAVEVHGPQSQPRKKEDFVHGHEFFVGQSVTLSGNTHFIYDADEFTRQYFEEELGMRLDPRWDVQLPERAVPRPITPPYNGYGSWDDSMSSVLNLIPKKPKKDLVKLFNHEGKILRFTARFADPKPEDQNRLFVFNFHMFDDTISIHEPPQRNLGIVTGRFLEKGVHMNQISGDLFKAEDLVPGNVVSVFNHQFEMLDCDEYTRKTFENPDMIHTKFDLAVVMEKLREAMRQQFPMVRDVFRRFDTDKDGVLTLSEFKAALAKYGFRLSDGEVLIIMKHCDTRQDGQVSYNEFCDFILEEDYTNEMLKTKPCLDETPDPEYAERAYAKTADRAETTEIRRALRELGDNVYQRHGVLPRLFKEFQKVTHENFVTNLQIKTALSNIGISFKLEDIDRCILHMYPNGDLSKVVYVHFFKSLITSHHDFNKVR